MNILIDWCLSQTTNMTYSAEHYMNAIYDHFKQSKSTVTISD